MPKHINGASAPAICDSIPITQSKLKELLHYDESTGIFTWLTKLRLSTIVGSNAGYQNKIGYVKIKLNGTTYQAHRLAFLYMTGEFPEITDHINGNRSDNRWENIRSVTRSGNMRNRKINSNNTSGLNGVYWLPPLKKWVSQICLDGKPVHLGVFDRIDDAKAARLAAEKMHGFHANHGHTEAERMAAEVAV